ncbi:MAG: transketolase C-terminal domain-containing protein, partial [Candidatus Spechtbacterales bacterium]
AAYEARWPVVFMVPIWSYGERECAAEIPKEKYLIPIGKAAVKRIGKDVTILADGLCLRAALNEAEFLAPDGIDCEVVDIRSYNPFDTETIGESIKKTERLVVMTEATPPLAELIIGKIVSNPELHDALTRTPKVFKEPGEELATFQGRVKKWLEAAQGLFGKFSETDLADRNLAPRIARLSKDITPISSVKDIEWNDLPFEQYEVMEIDSYGDMRPKKKLRSVRLAAIVHELMEWK